MTFITAEAVADLTGFASTATFLHARDRLERETGFPLPLPTCRRPLKWRKDAVQSWIDAQGLSAADAMTRDQANNSGPNTSLMLEASR